MKKLTCFFLMAVIALLNMYCAGTKEFYRNLPKTVRGLYLKADSLNTCGFIAEIGHGTSPNLTISRQMAFHHANSQIGDRLADSILVAKQSNSQTSSVSSHYNIILPQTNVFGSEIIRNDNMYEYYILISVSPEAIKNYLMESND